MSGFHRLAAGMHQQEAAGAIGVLRLPGLHAHLAEQRGLLVAGDAADGHLPAAEAGLAVDLG
ncbi:hypothetical protein D3C81_794350 [compost metagenome]